MRSIDIQGTGRMWTVTERDDTRHGGTYLFCECPSWKFKGQACKHTDAATLRWGLAAVVDLPTSAPQREDPLVLTTKPATRPEWMPSDEDRAVANALLAWTGGK